MLPLPSRCRSDDESKLCEPALSQMTSRQSILTTNGTSRFPERRALNSVGLASIHGCTLFASISTSLRCWVKGLHLPWNKYVQRFSRKSFVIALMLLYLPLTATIQSCPEGSYSLPVGIKFDVAVSDLVGWSLCMKVPYSDATTIGKLLSCAQSPRKVLLVGAIKTGQSILSMMAVASANEMLQSTNSTSTAVLRNGTFWYQLEGYSFGFSPTADIDLNYADTLMDSCESRLSWHLNNGIGGWRAGCDVDLSTASNWEKRVYVFSGDTKSTGNQTCGSCES